MDASRFDAITRALHSPAGRPLLALLLATPLALRGREAQDVAALLAAWNAS